MTSMPRGPLELSDDVALDLLEKLARQTAEDLGAAYTAPARDIIVGQLVNSHGRWGRKNGKGIYDYPADGRKTLWPGLAELAPVKITASDATLISSIRDRLLYRQAIEAARCIDEGVIADPRQADIGAILAWGFPSWTGGPLSFIEGIGLPAFIARARQLAADHGSRFTPPSLLLEMAETGRSFYGRNIRL